MIPTCDCFSEALKEAGCTHGQIDFGYRIGFGAVWDEKSSGFNTENIYLDKKYCCQCGKPYVEEKR